MDLIIKKDGSIEEFFPFLFFGIILCNVFKLMFSNRGKEAEKSKNETPTKPSEEEKTTRKTSDQLKGKGQFSWCCKAFSKVQR